MTVIGRLWPNFWKNLAMNRLIGSTLVPRAARWRLLRMFGMDLGRCRIGSGVFFGGSRVRIGSGTFINDGCIVDSSAPVSIGHNCDIAMRVLLLTGSHQLDGPSRRAGKLAAAPITVGNGVWIGAGAIVLPGVVIGDGAVVAAGAVVTSDCDSNVLHGGVPARFIRNLLG